MTILKFDPYMVIFKFWGSMWRVKTNSKFKKSFFPVLIYWSDNRIHLGFSNSGFSPPPLFIAVVTAMVDSVNHLWILRRLVSLWCLSTRTLFHFHCISRKVSKFWVQQTPCITCESTITELVATAINRERSIFLWNLNLAFNGFRVTTVAEIWKIFIGQNEF